MKLENGVKKWLLLFYAKRGMLFLNVIGILVTVI